MEATRLRRELEESRRTARPSAATGTVFEGIAGVSGTRSGGEVTATVESDVLFDSGRATVKPAAQQSLNQVASVLNSQYAGRQIRIVGHTDTDPIRRSGHKSNYHLGFERAYAVREHLISRGVSADRIQLASFGPHQPRGNKAQSRRVEIVVIDR
jgi:chemotaxis protein MotB